MPRWVNHRPASAKGPSDGTGSRCQDGEPRSTCSKSSSATVTQPVPDVPVPGEPGFAGSLADGPAGTCVEDGGASATLGAAVALPVPALHAQNPMADTVSESAGMQASARQGLHMSTSWSESARAWERERHGHYARRRTGGLARREACNRRTACSSAATGCGRSGELLLAAARRTTVLSTRNIRFGFREEGRPWSRSPEGRLGPPRFSGRSVYAASAPEHQSDWRRCGTTLSSPSWCSRCRWCPGRESGAWPSTARHGVRLPAGAPAAARRCDPLG
jgi:hypothetical protein